jgi:uncharacterized protein (TIGR03083 family)
VTGVSYLSPADVRSCFANGAAAFVSVVAAIGGDGWDRPALGLWTVRDLVGHTSRALSTIETYLAAPPPSEIVLHDPMDYLVAAGGPGLDHATVAARGRAAGAALGDDPVAAVQELVRRVTGLVDATPDDAPLAMIFGGTTLLTYLPTRTLELTVHTLDLTAATGVDPPPVLAAPIAACLALAAAAAGARPDAATLLRALMGRAALPPGFSLI